jgi:hypothetical protein
LLHIPQLFSSVRMLTHALAPPTTQSESPELQLTLQRAVSHAAVPPSGAVHWLPHAPQLLGSDEVVAHDWPHFVVPGEH